MIKYTISCVAALTLILFWGCNPENNDKVILANWYIGTTHYEVYDVTRTSNSSTHSLMGSDNTSSMVVFFPSFPTTDGIYSYKVVEEQKAALNQLGPNECALLINNGAADAYLSIGIDNDSVQIRVAGNRIGLSSVETSLVRYKHINGTNGSIIDTVNCGKVGLQEP